MSSNTLPSSGNRLADMDLAKGFAIVCVIMGHLYLYVWGNAQSSWLYRLVGSFEVQVFFLISGYFAYKEGFVYDFANLRLLLKKKLPLLISALAVGTLFCLSRRIELKQFLFSEMKEGYYFTFILFLMFLLFHGSNALVAKLRLRNFFAVMVFYCGIPLVLFLLLSKLPVPGQKLLSLHQWGGNYLFFLGGIILKREAKWYQTLLDSSAFALLALCIFAGSFLLPESCMNFPVVTLQRFTGIWLVIFTFYHYRDSTSNGICRCLNSLGRKSFGLYLFHFFFLVPATGIVARWDLGANSPLLLLLTLAVTATVVLCSLAIVKLVEANRILSYLLLGNLPGDK